MEFAPDFFGIFGCPALSLSLSLCLSLCLSLSLSLCLSLSLSGRRRAPPPRAARPRGARAGRARGAGGARARLSHCLSLALSLSLSLSFFLSLSLFVRTPPSIPHPTPDANLLLYCLLYTLPLLSRGATHAHSTGSILMRKRRDMSRVAAQGAPWVAPWGRPKARRRPVTCLDVFTSGRAPMLCNLLQKKRVLSSARALFEKHRFLCNFSLFLVRVRRPELFLQIWLALARCAWRPEA